MGRKKVTHQEVVADSETAMVIVIITVDLAVPVRLRPVAAIAIFGNLDRRQFLHIIGTKLGRERKTPHLSGGIFGHLDIVDRIVLVQVEVTNPWVPRVDSLLQIFGILDLLQQSGHRLEVQAIGRFRSHGHINVLIHVISARDQQRAQRCREDET